MAGSLICTDLCAWDTLSIVSETKGISDFGEAVFLFGNKHPGSNASEQRLELYEAVNAASTSRENLHAGHVLED
jgi:hypothetical protein